MFRSTEDNKSKYKIMIQYCCHKITNFLLIYTLNTLRSPLDSINLFITDTPPHWHTKPFPLNQLSIPMPFDNRDVYNFLSLSLTVTSVSLSPSSEPSNSISTP